VILLLVTTPAAAPAPGAVANGTNSKIATQHPQTTGQVAKRRHFCLCRPKAAATPLPQHATPKPAPTPASKSPPAAPPAQLEIRSGLPQKTERTTCSCSAASHWFNKRGPWRLGAGRLGGRPVGSPACTSTTADTAGLWKSESNAGQIRGTDRWTAGTEQKVEQLGWLPSNVSSNSGASVPAAMAWEALCQRLLPRSATLKLARAHLLPATLAPSVTGPTPAARAAYSQPAKPPNGITSGSCGNTRLYPCQ